MFYRQINIDRRINMIDLDQKWTTNERTHNEDRG